MPNLFSLENLFYSWKRLERGKSGKKDIVHFKRYLEDNLFSLHQEISGGAYEHGRYEHFLVYDTKKRSIHKPSVKDRVVHEAVRKHLEGAYGTVFIKDTYSSLKWRGVSAALNRAVFFARTVYTSNFGRCYILKCDVKKYFNNINHNILIKLIENQDKDERTLEIIKKIISSFGEHGKGIPLGNSVSQIFSNIYLNELDQFVKNILRVRFYIRYNDDLIIADSRVVYLEKIKKRIEGFIREKLRLEIPPEKTSIVNFKNGFEFLGYRILPDCVLLRKKTKRLIFERVRPKNVSSYTGLLSIADAHFLKQKILSLVRNSIL